MCVVLLYGVQGDVADIAGVAALQACEEKPVLMNPEVLISSVLHTGKHRAAPEENTLVPGLWTILSQNGI